MSEIAKITTMQYFNTDDEPYVEEGEVNEWPPFRKVGLYDPYSDDPRLGKWENLILGFLNDPNTSISRKCDRKNKF